MKFMVISEKHRAQEIQLKVQNKNGNISFEFECVPLNFIEEMVDHSQPIKITIEIGWSTFLEKNIIRITLK